MQSKKYTIVGTVGVPGNYGGFETLADNLVRYHHMCELPSKIVVYCSSNSYPEKRDMYLSAQLKYIPFNANGVESIPYDIISLFSSIFNRSDAILLLGVSGAIALPLVRLFSPALIITNVDGIEWRRQKWKGLIKWFLHFSEKMAVRFSHKVIADNRAIAKYIRRVYGIECHVIAYGGDHAINVDFKSVEELKLPKNYSFSVCRIEPENNVRMIIEAFSRQKEYVLVIVGNWNNSDYGKAIREQYKSCSNLYLLDPIYDLGKLRSLRSHALFYIHGHSAGGTNPSLVEAMHFGRPVLAYDCSFNRSTTENKAMFFRNAEELEYLISTTDVLALEQIGADLLEIARHRYTWEIVASKYFDLFS